MYTEANIPAKKRSLTCRRQKAWLELARASLLTVLGLAGHELAITEAAWHGLKPSINLITRSPLKIVPQASRSPLFWAGFRFGMLITR